MKPILSFLILVSLLTACSSKKHFTSRKYTSGRYVSNSPHKQKLTKHPKKVNEIATAAEIDRKNETSVVVPELEKITKANDVVTQKQEEKRNLTIVKSNKVFFEKALLTQAFNKNTKEQKKSKLVSEESSEKVTNSLISVFLSAGAILAAVAALIVAIATAEFYFLIISLVALVLAIVGLSLGIKGMKEYKTEKSKGNKKTSTLILGIVGTALGGVGIFLSIYFALAGTIFVASSQ